jgi:hypothetical protein
MVQPTVIYIVVVKGFSGLKLLLFSPTALLKTRNRAAAEYYSPLKEPWTKKSIRFKPENRFFFFILG